MSSQEVGEVSQPVVRRLLVHCARKDVLLCRTQDVLHWSMSICFFAVHKSAMRTVATLGNGRPVREGSQ